LGGHGCTGEAAQHARDLGQARRAAGGPDASHVHTTAERLVDRCVHTNEQQEQVHTYQCYYINFKLMPHDWSLLQKF